VNKYTLQKVGQLIGASLVLACIIYVFNLWLLSSRPLISPPDASFFEGLIFIITGALFCIGSGGITRTTQSAARLAAVAGALGDDVIGPSEVFRRDAWRPKGFVRFGLVLIFTGIMLLIIYFISFYTMS
jgi:hypothetical protein